MADYEFCVSLRINHPNIDPAEVTKKLKLEPFITRKVNEPRVTPKGDPLEGLNEESFWAAKLHDSKRISSAEICLEDYLLELNEQLNPHAAYFKELVSSGGYIEYFVGWFGGSMIGATLEPELLLSTGALNISIGLDIYGGEDE